MLRRDFIKAVLAFPLLYSRLAMGEDVKVLGCTLKADRLYRIEPYRMLFQWVKDEGAGVYSVGMVSILAALSYPLYSIRVKPVGTNLEFDDNLATVEAGKRIATFPTPLSGEVVAVNEEVIKNPELVNRKPYTYWIAKIKATKPEELRNLQRVEEVYEEIKGVIIKEDIDCSKVEE
ncbi:glycine cleavage system H protein [Hydrogenivirga caldilitoris]|uniref:Glycine cleavage system H protein n=1 Tax=Hydrogenivirga caldilitoris TaxID=246264 RepID=A0A497XQ34_9AQUI|nr:glycine cleavage system protein H [Hydrogenivirga caldilitoris]RLJ71106.1 glycine cleavage system H protein [Hydrogenivirga caldilitoris]